MEIDRNAPAPKGDVQDLEVRVRIDARFHEFEHRMEQLIQDSETRILQAFYGYAEGMQRLA